MTTDSERVEAVARALCFADGAQGCGCEDHCRSDVFRPDDIFMRYARAAIASLSSIPAQHDGPTIESLRAKVERASERGPVGPDLGAMSHSERNEHLFGLVKQLRYWESDGHPHGLLHRESADRITELEAQLAAAQQEEVTPEMVEDALHARVPGGAEVWCFLPQEDAFTPHQTARDVMRCAIEAAMRSAGMKAEG